MPTRHYADSSRLFDTDMDAMLLGLQGVGVFSGLVCSAAGTDTTVSWTAGVAFSGSKLTWSVAASSINLSSLQHATAPRKALLYVDDADGVVKAVAGDAMTPLPTGKLGRATYQPSPPDFAGGTALDAYDVVVAEIWLPATGANILASYVTDRRVMTQLIPMTVD